MLEFGKYVLKPLEFFSANKTSQTTFRWLFGVKPNRANKTLRFLAFNLRLIGLDLHVSLTNGYKRKCFSVKKVGKLHLCAPNFWDVFICFEIKLRKNISNVPSGALSFLKKIRKRTNLRDKSRKENERLKIGLLSTEAVRRCIRKMFAQFNLIKTEKNFPTIWTLRIRACLEHSMIFQS